MSKGARDRFICRYMEGGKTPLEVMAEMGMRPRTLLKWFEKFPEFRELFETATACLGVIAEGAAAVAGRGTAASSGEGEGGGAAGRAKVEVRITRIDGGSEAVKPRALPRGEGGGEDEGGALDGMSEREWLVAMNGPEAGEAYDELVRMRLEREAREAADGVVDGGGR